MAKKPQGGPHAKERKTLLANHGANYVQYKKGEITESELREEVLGLESLGITFPEIVQAREKALRPKEGACATMA